MKRYSVLLAIALTALMVAATAAVAQEKKADDKAAPKGKEVTMTGKLSCTVCTMTHPDTPCPAGCCESCIKAGDAPLFTDKDGNQFVLASSKMKEALMTPERLKLAGGSVTVKGTLMAGKGVNVIVVDTMEKAAEATKAAAK